MKKYKKRLASILLTLVMAMTLFFAAPMTVYAATNYIIGTGETYTTWDDFITTAPALVDGDTITLSENLSGTKALEIINIDVTLDLAGSTLTITVDSLDPALKVEDGSLTVIGTGALNVNNIFASGGAGIYVSNGSLNAEGVNVTGTGEPGVIVNGIYGTATAIVAGATGTGTSGYGAYAYDGGQITVNGDAEGVSAGASASGPGSTIEVKGNVTGTGTGSYGAEASGGGQITIDGTITADNYISLEGNDYTITGFTLLSQKAGYIEYTYSTNFVWVKGYNSAAIQDFGTFTGSGTATGKSDLNDEDFEVLALKGTQVDEFANFDITTGSTIITLREAYLKTFPNGTYTFRAFFNTTVDNFIGIAYTDLILTVNYPGAPEPDPNNPGGPVGPGGDVDTPGPGGPGGGGANGVPQTSDVNNTLGWTVVLALVILGGFGLLAWRRKQRA